MARKNNRWATISPHLSTEVFSVFSCRPLGALSIHAKIPYVQVHAVRQNLCERIFAAGKILAERKTKDVLRHVPSLHRNRISIFRNILPKQASNRFNLPLSAFHRQPDQLDLRAGLTRATAFLDRRSRIRIGRRFPQIEFRTLGINAPRRFGAGNLNIAFAWNNRHWRQNLFQTLFSIGSNVRAHLVQRRYRFSFHYEHALTGRQKNTCSHGQAGIDVRRYLRLLLQLFVMDCLQQSVFLARGCRFSLCRCVPIHHRRGDLLPISAFCTKVADSFTRSLVLANNLESAVLQDKFLPTSRSSEFYLVG